MKKEIWIFLSHSYEDYDRVRYVRNLLEDFGMRPIMFFLKCLSEEKEIDDLIKREIDCRTRFILCDSPNARKSNWVQKEIEYIKSKRKGIEIIDINDSDENIRKKLFSYQRKNHLYISYGREQGNLARQVTNRLRKYDFNVFFEMDSISIQMNFADVLKEGIRQSIEHGKLIALLDSKVSQWISTELEYAIKQDSEKDSIIPVILTNEAKMHYSKILKEYPGIDVSSISDERAFYIVNSLLTHFFDWGDILTYANNFRYGIGCNQDVEEANILAELYVSEVEKRAFGYNGPGMELHLASLYSKGYGVSQNLTRAKELLYDAYHNWGIDVSSMLRAIKEQENNGGENHSQTFEGATL